MLAPKSKSHSDLPPRLTVSQNEAARLLDVCRDTVIAMAERGELERVRISTRKYGIKFSSLQKLLGEGA